MKRKAIHNFVANGPYQNGRIARIEDADPHSYTAFCRRVDRIRNADGSTTALTRPPVEARPSVVVVLEDRLSIIDEARIWNAIADIDGVALVEDSALYVASVISEAGSANAEQVTQREALRLLNAVAGAQQPRGFDTYKVEAKRIDALTRTDDQE